MKKPCKYDTEENNNEELNCWTETGGRAALYKTKRINMQWTCLLAVQLTNTKVLKVHTMWNYVSGS